MEPKLKLTMYLACAMEHASLEHAVGWKVKVKEELCSPFIGIYDPVEQEEAKTGKPLPETAKYIYGLKRGGHSKFHDQMNKIWWGDTEPRIGNKIKMLELFRDRASIDGNYKSEFPHWGDFEAVARSNFIIAYIEKNVLTVGTHHEILTAYLLDIPVFLILGNDTRSNANSTLVNKVEMSGGERGKIFYTVDDCLHHIKEIYSIDKMLGNVHQEEEI